MAAPQRRDVVGAGLVAVADNATPEEIERHWFKHVYRGDRMRQLSVRAMVMGMLLGAVMAVSNIYVSLKAGWTVGVGITACILAYSAFASLHRLFPRAFPAFTILENNAMQSCATAAGTIDPSAVPHHQGRNRIRHAPANPCKASSVVAAAIPVGNGSCSMLRRTSGT